MFGNGVWIFSGGSFLAGICTSPLLGGFLVADFAGIYTSPLIWWPDKGDVGYMVNFGEERLGGKCHFLRWLKELISQSNNITNKIKGFWIAK